jgi:hypothetical protein
MPTPNFFIVGAPKSGTTALWSYLRQHPEIFMPGRKEPHFFCSDIVSSQFVRDRGTYLGLFAEAHDQKRVGEASVLYLYSQTAATAIKQFCDDARIIVMLRNPIEMMYALHSQLLFSSQENITDFKDALNAEAERKNGLRIPVTNTTPAKLFYRSIARYSEQLQRYFDQFDRDKIRVIVYDEFNRDAAGVYAGTLRFLGVDSGFEPVFRRINANKRTRSQTLDKISRKLKSSRGEKFYRSRSVLYNLIRSLNTQQAERPPMDPDLKKTLTSEFAPEVEKLSNLIGCNLDSWRLS